MNVSRPVSEAAAKSLLIFSVMALASMALFVAWRTGRDYPVMVDAGGHRLRMYATGRGHPTVVLDCGTVEFWSEIQPEIAKFTKVVSYDRAGWLGSESGPRPRTAEQVALELHTALHNANLPPPYVLVAHSLAGAFARVFAYHYPDDVAGLVLLDPTQPEFIHWLKKHHPDLNVETYPTSLWELQRKTEQQQDELGSSEVSLAQAEAAQPLPDIPVVVITGTLVNDNPGRKSDIVNALYEAQEHWLKNIPHSKHILAKKSTHEIPIYEPELVIDAIKDVCQEVNKSETPPASAKDHR